MIKIPKKLYWVLAPLAFVECTGFLSEAWAPYLYAKTSVIEKLRNPSEEEKFDRILESTLSYDYGWKPTRVGSGRIRDCKNKAQTLTNDTTGVRTYTGYNASKAQVMLLGDSYVWGGDVSDDQTIAAHIFKDSGIIAANLGYGGYSPVQSYLRGVDDRDNFPQAKVVVLGIMHENIRRIMNGYRPVLSGSDAIAFSFRPYMKDGKIIPINPDVFESWPNFIEASEAAFQDDYMAKPVHTFPYGLALIKSLQTQEQSKRFANFFHEYSGYEYEYQDKAMGENLLALLLEFNQWARSENLVPIVVFIPQRISTASSPDEWLEIYKDRLPRDLVVSNIDVSEIDKEQYNKTSNGDCGPSDYGAEQLAKQFTTLIKTALPKAKK